jgi:hypothetical protein
VTLSKHSLHSDKSPSRQQPTNGHQVTLLCTSFSYRWRFDSWLSGNPAGCGDGLRDALHGTAQIRISDCLDAYEHSNVVIVTPSPTARRHGARPVWLGEVLDPDTITDLADWVRTGGRSSPRSGHRAREDVGTGTGGDAAVVGFRGRRRD